MGYGTAETFAGRQASKDCAAKGRTADDKTNRNAAGASVVLTCVFPWAFVPAKEGWPIFQ